MSKLFEKFPLKSRNTFGLDHTSDFFFEATDKSDLLLFIKERIKPGVSYMMIGEGSNILFTGDYHGTLIHPAIKGTEVIEENKDKIIVRVGAGENWDEFVINCVRKNWYGLENLSMIPGSVGSSPVQNIGAYGVEAKDSIFEVEGFFLESGKQQVFKNAECRFGYRSSIFKLELKNRFVITSVSYSLSKHPHFELGYGPVEREFLRKPVKDLSNLRQTIIDIRKSKLPDPNIVGNAGSFFKNPVLSNPEFDALKKKLPSVPSYPIDEKHTKVPAAWLIEHAGLKGFREGNVGTFPTQPLVIVNYGGANGEEIYNFAKKIVATVNSMSGITLEMEVNLV